MEVSVNLDEIVEEYKQEVSRMHQELLVAKVALRKQQEQLDGYRAAAAARAAEGPQTSEQTAGAGEPR